jgi:hypothetical protein
LGRGSVDVVSRRKSRLLRAPTLLPFSPRLGPPISVAKAPVEWLRPLREHDSPIRARRVSEGDSPSLTRRVSKRHSLILMRKRGAMVRQFGVSLLGLLLLAALSSGCKREAKVIMPTATYPAAGPVAGVGVGPPRSSPTNTTSPSTDRTKLDSPRQTRPQGP